MRISWVGVVVLMALSSCDGEPDHCRFDPDCGGGIGGFCDSIGDCDEGECCRTDNCGGGMCTYRCANDNECPEDMLCEHGNCFFACSDDRDCASGQSCEHGRTVCEWDGG